MLDIAAMVRCRCRLHATPQALTRRLSQKYRQLINRSGFDLVGRKVSLCLTAHGTGGLLLHSGGRRFTINNMRPNPVTKCLPRNGGQVSDAQRA
jgi:hypothetical protein